MWGRDKKPPYFQLQGRNLSCLPITLIDITTDQIYSELRFWERSSYAQRDSVGTRWT
jgi:hypothetical protein